MTGLGAWLVEPFVEFAFMRRALAAVAALALGAGPLGVFLVLRRMSLVGDATAHAVLPGAAVGFLVAGPTLVAMGTGGFLAALLVALAAGVVARRTVLREDASFAAFYLIALALGVLLVSLRGSQVDLMHLLFGTILAVDDAGLLLVATVATLTVAVLAVCYRPLVVETLDPGFLRLHGGGGGWHLLFVALLVANLVAAFQVLGTLMAVGLMMLPAAAARLWRLGLGATLALAAGFALAAGGAGLLISFHRDLPSGPTIVLAAGFLYLASLLAAPLLGPEGRLRLRHREA
ncbi:MAG: metal ABC transporter permease [Steroidobacteraceae bacterium]|jgi:zinc/manganese transport system permease protein|nr:metal ABC transporter permease [Steroidobacteraceae bacterium]